MCLILRREIVLCSEKEVRQKEQGQTKEMNQSGKPSPELVRIRDWEARGRTDAPSNGLPSLTPGCLGMACTLDYALTFLLNSFLKYPTHLQS